MLHLETIKAVIDAAERAAIPTKVTIVDSVNGVRDVWRLVLNADIFIRELRQALEDDAVNT